jgi:hypothetical protein
MKTLFEVWTSPGGKVWEGFDQEEAVLHGMQNRKDGYLIEVAEIFDVFGQIRPRRIAVYDDRTQRSI